MPLNYMRTAMLLAFLSAIFVAMGYVIGGPTGILVAFAIAIAMNVFSFWNSDTLVLKMYGASPVDETSAPEFYAMVKQLARNAELPMPRVYIMDNPQPNAFATGRNPEHAAVCASTGLLDMLDSDEVAAVMAHELAHVKSYDTLTMTVAAVIGGAISMLAQYMQFSMLFGGMRRNDSGGGILQIVMTVAAMLLAPFAAMLVQMAVSRSREYQADRLGAKICGNPYWLASALHKIQNGAQAIPNEIAEGAPATAHMFIINPLTGRKMDSMFSTHPSTQNRISELEKLGAEWRSSDRPRRTAPMARAQVEFPGPWAKTARKSGAGSTRGASNEGRFDDTTQKPPRRRGDGPLGPWG